MSVVICNGMQEKAIKNILSGRRLGTFFTEDRGETIVNAPVVEILAENGMLTYYKILRLLTVLKLCASERTSNYSALY